MIDSLVSSIDICDSVRIKKRKDDEILIHMRGLGAGTIETEENNAYIAAKKFAEKFDVSGMDIFIDKNIPMGAGLGGSSADAAAVLSMLPALFEVGSDNEVKLIADSVGSDVGYMMRGGYARLRGRGNEVEYLDSDLKLDVLLCIPRTHMSTSQCYATYDKIHVRTRPTTEDAIAAMRRKNIGEIGKALSNGLFPAARVISSDVATAYSDLLSFAPSGVNMTGSGCSVYAICDNDMFCRYMKSRLHGPYDIIQAKTVRPVRQDKDAEEKNG